MSDESTPQLDVIIVGYGPVGQTLAALLGSYGHQVLVLERHYELYGLPRAGHFDHEIMGVFRRLGIGADVAAIAIPATRYQFRDADGRLIAELTRPLESPSGGPWSYHFYQPDLEVLLDARARAEPTVTVLQGWEVEALTRGSTTTVTAIDRQAGQRRTWSARYVVGADGANSIVRESVGIATVDLGFRADWLVVDVALDDGGRRLARYAETNQILDAARPAYVGKLDDTRARWEFMLLDGDDPATIASAPSVRALLRRWLPEDEGTIVRSAIYRFESVLAHPWRVGDVLLAGDAAHRMPPFLGQGMCSGIRDAATLSWTLDFVIRGRADARLLDSYELTRAEHVRRFIDASVEVGKTVCITDPDEVAAVTARLRETPPTPPPWSPPVGPALIRAGDVLAGTLAVRPDGTWPAGFQLISRAGSAHHDLDERQRARADRLAVRFVEVADDQRAARWIADHDVAAVLVRPDSYVLGSTRSSAGVGELLEFAAEAVALR